MLMVRTSAINSAGSIRRLSSNISGFTLKAKMSANSFLRGEASGVFWYAWWMVAGRYLGSGFSGIGLVADLENA